MQISYPLMTKSIFIYVRIKPQLAFVISQTATDGEIESLVFVKETHEAMSDLLMQQSLVDYAKVIFEKRLLDQSFDDIREYNFD